LSQGEGIYRPSPGRGSLLQGEILSDLPQVILTIPEDPSIAEREFDIKEHPWVIVMSQDCDLDQDFNKGAGSSLPNILFCEVSTAAKALELIKAAGGPASQISGRIKINNEPRYHFLQKPSVEHDACNEGLEEFVIDFKRYFTLPTQEVYFQLTQRTRRRCILNSPYLEHLAQRFHSYLSRIALDSDHVSE